MRRLRTPINVFVISSELVSQTRPTNNVTLIEQLETFRNVALSNQTRAFGGAVASASWPLNPRAQTGACTLVFVCTHRNHFSECEPCAHARIDSQRHRLGVTSDSEKKRARMSSWCCPCRPVMARNRDPHLPRIPKASESDEAKISFFRRARLKCGSAELALSQECRRVGPVFILFLPSGTRSSAAGKNVPRKKEHPTASGTAGSGTRAELDQLSFCVATKLCC